MDGIPHFLSTPAAGHLLDLASVFEVVWASGWEEKADEYLPGLLGVPSALPHLSFDASRAAVSARAHWKLAAIEEHAGPRPLAWIDDAFNDACWDWAAARGAPTLLVPTDPSRGLGAEEAQALRAFAARGADADASR